jgi:hypothetical protein
MEAHRDHRGVLRGLLLQNQCRPGEVQAGARSPGAPGPGPRGRAKGAHEVRRGAECALAKADATINSLRRDAQRLEDENSATVQQVMEISRELQEARDSKAEARMLRRQRV